MDELAAVDPGPTEDQVADWNEHDAHAYGLIPDVPDDPAPGDGEIHHDPGAGESGPVPPLCYHRGGDTRDPTSCEECENDQNHDKTVRHLLGELAGHVHDATVHVAHAYQPISELTGRFYDIELAESADGQDIKDELTVAARALRNVERAVKGRALLLAEG